MRPFKKCILSGLEFDDTVKFHNQADATYLYEYRVVGRVYISDWAKNLIERGNYDKFILTGMCRTAFELKQDAPLIDENLLNDLTNLHSIPRSFEEKCDQLLLTIYNMGGKHNASLNFISQDDYPLGFAQNAKEFNEIIRYLNKFNFLNWNGCHTAYEENFTIYTSVEITREGFEYIKELKRNQSKVSISIPSTGDITTDNKLFHAKKLFDDNPTLENKRSACQTLCLIIEPLRKKLTGYFTDEDVNLFFRLVNEFDIRHQKIETKQIKYEEQLDWIYYSLLNTIITFYKIQEKYTTSGFKR